MFQRYPSRLPWICIGMDDMMIGRGWHAGELRGDPFERGPNSLRLDASANQRDDNWRHYMALRCYGLKRLSVY